MAVSSVGALIGIIFGAICVVVLVAVGITTIRSGRTSLARVRAAGQKVAWHKQVAILFGICNIVFAGILMMIIFLTVTIIAIIKTIIFVVLGILLVLSVLLVVFCIAAALRVTQQLARPPQDKDPS